jgi:hypothetical protein
VGTAACSPAQSCKATVHGAVEQLPRHFALVVRWLGAIIVAVRFAKSNLGHRLQQCKPFQLGMYESATCQNAQQNRRLSLLCKYKTEDIDRSISEPHFFADVSGEHVAAAAEFNMGVRCSCHS